MRPLKLVHPQEVTLSERVSVAFGSTQSELMVIFEVESASDYVNPELSTEGSQPGLWDWDVVEVFLQNPARDRYFEFQLSPLGQHFELEILEPRKRVNDQYRSSFAKQVKRISATRWEARFRISWKALGFGAQPTQVFGNAFAILGEPERRHYWSLLTPPQEKPDFHIPKHFGPLLKSSS